jgi:membrane associated rhomboid family serine protease
MSNYYQYEQRMFSFGDRITWAVQRLILLNAGIFALQLVLNLVNVGDAATLIGYKAPGLFVSELFAFSPQAVFSGWLWTPFTYMALHASLSHLFFNMLWLFFFGPEVERTLGTRQFIQFYVVCGAVGVMGELLLFFATGVPVSVVGASGAVMGVLVAFAMVNPDREFFLFPLPMPINARAMVVFVLVLNALSALGIQGGRESFMTHLGGMGVGFLYMKLIPWFNRLEWAPRKKRFKGRKVDEIDRVGEAVDNIFEFDDKRRKKD